MPLNRKTHCMYSIRKSQERQRLLVSLEWQGLRRGSPSIDFSSGSCPISKTCLRPRLVNVEAWAWQGASHPSKVLRLVQPTRLLRSLIGWRLSLWSSHRVQSSTKLWLLKIFSSMNLKRSNECTSSPKSHQLWWDNNCSIWTQAWPPLSAIASSSKAACKTTKVIQWTNDWLV